MHSLRGHLKKTSTWESLPGRGRGRSAETGERRLLGGAWPPRLRGGSGPSPALPGAPSRSLRPRSLPHSALRRVLPGPLRTCPRGAFQETRRALGRESSDPLGCSPARLGLSFLLGSATGSASARTGRSRTLLSGERGRARGKGGDSVSTKDKGPARADPRSLPGARWPAGVRARRGAGRAVRAGQAGGVRGSPGTR